MKKILYFFTGGRRARLTQWQQGAEMPLEFLYGAPYLQQQGHHVDLLELADLRPETNDPEYHRLARLNTSHAQQYEFYSVSHQLLGELDRLNTYDVIIAGGEDSGAGLTYFTESGRLKPPVFFFVMGMLDLVAAFKAKQPERAHYRTLAHYWHARLRQPRYRRSKALYGQMVRQSAGILCFGQGEYQLAVTLFPQQQQKCHFLPFAVDTNFWRPAEQQKPVATPSILFMGKDYQRDFDLVVKIAASRPQYHFRLITRNIRPEAVPPNADVLAGDWKEAVYSDAEIRAFLQDCSLVILPLKESSKPSGQSVALQAMACGKPVLISHTAGFWEPKTFIDCEHLCFVRSNDLTTWGQAIDRLMQHPAERAALGRQARQLIERNNNLEQFGKRLESIVIPAKGNRE